MLDKRRFSLNRIACPKLPLDQFFALSKSIGIGQVELRNDLGDGLVTGTLKPDQVAAAASQHGIDIITINALQKFNLEAVRNAVMGELERLVTTAKQIRCKAIVLCPNNDTADRRPAEQKYRETVSALKVFRPVFEANGAIGLIEPLGFAECSLRSAQVALCAITESGGACFKIVHDTFHHHLGTDSAELLGVRDYAAAVGLIHVSGVEAGVPKSTYRDPHRILLGAGDKLASRDQIHALTAAGYAGPISFEPFASEVQALEPKALAAALQQSIGYLS